jgi:hypothetical protein
MPLKDSKEFAGTAEALETLADGVQIHNGETDFPSKVKESEIRDQKLLLEKDREAFEKAQAKADQFGEVYKATLKASKTMIADDQRALQSFHGLRSEKLKDYGFQPPKPGGRRGPRPPKPE